MKKKKVGIELYKAGLSEKNYLELIVCSLLYFASFYFYLTKFEPKTSFQFEYEDESFQDIFPNSKE